MMTAIIIIVIVCLLLGVIGALLGWFFTKGWAHDEADMRGHEEELYGDYGLPKIKKPSDKEEMNETLNQTV